MAKQFTVSISEGQAAGPYNIYYDTVNASNYATLVSTSGNATSITLAELTGYGGVVVSVPDSASKIIIFNTDANCQNSYDLILPTPTPTPTPTAAPATATPTPTPTSAPAATATPTPTPTAAPAATATPTPTPTSGGGSPATATPTPTPVSATATPTPTPAPGGGSPTATPTPTPTAAPAPATPTPTPTVAPATPTPTPTSAPAATATPTPTPSNSWNLAIEGNYGVAGYSSIAYGATLSLTGMAKNRTVTAGPSSSCNSGCTTEALTSWSSGASGTITVQRTAPDTTADDNGSISINFINGSGTVSNTNNPLVFSNGDTISYVWNLSNVSSDAQIKVVVYEG